MSDINFELNHSQYRIHRPDNLNLSIQKLGGRTWRTLSYHGSSLHSLAHGLKGLIADSCVPDPAGSLGEQLDKIIAEIDSYGQAILAALDAEGGALKTTNLTPTCARV